MFCICLCQEVELGGKNREAAGGGRERNEGVGRAWGGVGVHLVM